MDIHHDAVHGDRIAARLRAMPITAEALFSEARPLPALKNIRVLSPRDSLICLAVHALKHDFSRAVWFLDADRLLKKCPELISRPDELTGRANDFNARFPVYLFFSLLQSWCRYPDSSVLRRLRPKRFGPVSRFFLKRLIAHRPIPYFGELSHLLMMTSLRDRAAFIRETLFPSRQVMQQVFPNMRSGPSWRYYPKRIARLARMGIDVFRAALCAPGEPET